MSDRDPIELKLSYPELVKLFKDVTYKSMGWIAVEDADLKDYHSYLVANGNVCPPLYALARWNEDSECFLSEEPHFPLKVTHVFDFPRLQVNYEE